MQAKFVLSIKNLCDFAPLRLWVKLITLALFGSLFLACRFTSQVNPTPTPLPSAQTSTPSPSPTSTLTPTRLPTGTPTLTPTQTPTVTPTFTPVGYLLQAEEGYALVYPPEWTKTEEAGALTLVDEENGLFFLVNSGLEDVETSMDEFITGFGDSAFDKKYKASDPYEVELADGVTAPAVDYTVTTSDGVDLTWQVAYKHFAGRYYVIMAAGRQEIVQSQQATIDRLYKSIELFVPTLFGTAGEDTLRILGNEPEPEDLDPATTTGSANGAVGWIYAGLVRLDGKMQIAPDLAERWTVSPDGVVYTFTLRSGLHFNSGKAITAEEVKKSWERAADPAIESSTVLTYLGDILGVKDMLDGKATELSGVKVIDDLTLEVTLDGPKPYFLGKLTYPTSFVVNLDAAKGAVEDWAWKPDASGPYLLKEYREGEALLFERNPSYHQPAAIPYIAERFYTGGSSISVYEAGGLDFVYIANEDVQRVQNTDDPLHDQWSSFPSLCTYYLTFSNSLPPFDDLQVRKAFAQTVDRDTFVERLTANTDITAFTLLPPSMPGFSQDLSAYLFDPQAARESLAASSYAGKLPEVILHAAGYGDSDRADVNLFVETWKKELGVTVKVEYLDPLKFSEAARKEDGHITLGSWCADYPDPQNFLDVLYRSTSDFNASGYSNPEVDALLDQANEAVDPTKRLELYSQVEKILLEEAANVPVDYTVYNVLVQPRLLGFQPHPQYGVYVLDLSIKP
jgi:oligopeptide transport system substrate-binding protein